MAKILKYGLSKNDSNKSRKIDKLTDEQILAKGIGYRVYKVGDIVTLNYFGNPTEFRVVHKNYKTKNKIVLVAEQSVADCVFQTDCNYYSASYLRMYMRDVVYQGFSEPIQNAIETTPIESDGKILNDKVWALSMTEVGLSNTYAPTEGSRLSYFDSNSKRTKNNYWWLRTPYTGSSNGAWNVDTGGSYYNSIVSNSNGVVPAFEI